MDYGYEFAYERRLRQERERAEEAADNEPDARAESACGCRHEDDHRQAEPRIERDGVCISHCDSPIPAPSSGDLFYAGSGMGFPAVTVAGVRIAAGEAAWRAVTAELDIETRWRVWENLRAALTV